MMNKNKGIIGIGLILAIILGVVVIGGGAYYLGKKNISKQEVNNLPTNQNLPVVDNSQQANITNPTVTTECTSSSVPLITVLSPNGGEVYQAGQQIAVKWKSCNVPANTQLTIGLSMSVASGSHTISLPIIKNTPNDESETFVLNSTIYDYFGKTDRYPFKIYIGSGGPTGAYDESDNSFTINSTSTKTISTALPQYIGTHSDCGGLSSCWPPVIIISSKSYSCNNIGVAPNTEGNDVTAQRVINGRTYCIHSLSDGYAGGRGYTYTYTTSNGNGTKIATFGLTYQSCGVYGGPTDPTVIQCQSNQSTFLNKLDQMVDSLM